jgi:hypothetical protein
LEEGRLSLPAARVAEDEDLRAVLELPDQVELDGAVRGGDENRGGDQ